MSDKSESSKDLVFIHSKREAGWIMISWAFFLIWTVGYAAIFGYDKDVESMQLVIGIPAWIFWGVLTPWVVATGFSVWFGLVFMKDDTLDR